MFSYQAIIHSSTHELISTVSAIVIFPKLWNLMYIITGHVFYNLKLTLILNLSSKEPASYPSNSSVLSPPLRVVQFSLSEEQFLVEAVLCLP